MRAVHWVRICYCIIVFPVFDAPPRCPWQVSANIVPGHPDAAFKATLDAAASEVQAACKDGPYGQGGKKALPVEAVPQVATIQ